MMNNFQIMALLVIACALGLGVFLCIIHETLKDIKKKLEDQ